MIGRWGAFILFLLMAPAHAVVPDAGGESVSTHYTHTAWTTKDGAPAGITGISQGKDGWLWFGGPSGLYRFDGKTFERRDPFPADDVSSRRVIAMYAAPSGNRWVAFASGRIAVFHPGEDKPARILALPGGHRPDAFLEDGTGRVFAIDESTLFVLRDDAFVAIDDSWKFDGADMTSAMVDLEGNVWICTTKHLLELKRGATQFSIDAHGEYADGGFNVAADGRLWHDNEQAGIGYYPGSVPHPAPDVANDSVSIIDRFGAFWRVACPTGVCRVPRPETYKSAEAFSKAVMGARYDADMSSPAAATMMEDRDGNIWVATAGGVDRFRRNVAIQTPVPDAPAFFTLVVDRSGETWMGTSNQANPNNYWWHLVDGVPKRVGDFRNYVSAAFADRDGTVILSGEGGTWRFSHGLFTPMQAPSGRFDGHTRSIARDASGDLWFTYRNRPLKRLTGTTWIDNGGLAFPPLSAPVLLATDAAGRLLIGYKENAFAMVDGSRVKVFGEKEGLATGTIDAILPGHPLLVGGERGVAMFSNGRFQMLRFSDPEAVRAISGLLTTPDGALWLNGSAGVVRIDRQDVAKAMADPSQVIPVRVYGQGEGVPGGAQPATGHTLVQGGDGRLWIASSGGLAWIDPLHLSVNTRPPEVYIRSVVADGTLLDAAKALTVPHGTHALRFEFTAVVLADASRAKFRYQLSGVDAGWQTAGDQHEANYSNLRPGKYVFHVIASNEDGVWNTDGATMEVTIPPAFYQTPLFAVIVCAVLLLLAFLAYRRHIGQVRRTLTRQMLERHAERERIARELHDTIFQDMQALLMVVRAHRESSASTQGSGMDRAIENAEGALVKGRERIEKLRNMEEPGVDIQARLHDMIDGLPDGCASKLHVQCRGSAWPLSSDVADEIAWIAREAVLNACAHAKASVIEVSIVFSRRHLMLAIVDDGIGIAVEILSGAMHSGRWGLQGMRERAASVGARFCIENIEAGGTRISIKVARSRRAVS